MIALAKRVLFNRVDKCRSRVTLPCAQHVSVRLALQKITRNPRRFVMKFRVASGVALTALIVGLGRARADENLQTLPTEISIAE
jgi:hypothetical protein